MNIRYVLIIIVVIVLLGGGIFAAWHLFEGSGTVETPVVETPTPQAPTTSTYASSTLGVTITYPAAFTLNDSYAYDAFGQQKLIHGVQFVIPAAMATGTLASDSGLSLEWLPNARSCTGDIYLKANVKASSVSDGNTTYSLATSTTSVSGGKVDEMVYALPASSPCMAVRYYIHTLAASSTEPFDNTALLAQFDTIRRSLSVSH